MNAEVEATEFLNDTFSPIKVEADPIMENLEVFDSEQTIEVAQVPQTEVADPVEDSEVELSEVEDVKIVQENEDIC